MSEPTGHHGDTPPYDPLSEAEAWRIVDATLELMRESGVQFDPDPRVLDLFSGAGCDVSPDGRVKFAPEPVREALDSVPRSARIWNRDGSDFIQMDNRHTWFSPGMTAIKVFDVQTGKRRESTREDLADITRVADALPDIDAVCVACKIVEHSTVQGEIEEFAVLAANTAKPLEYLCETDLALEAAIELGAAARGGADRLAEKPYFIHGVTPLPLYFAKAHTDQIIRAVEHGIPVTAGTLTIGGASTPITIAGNLVHGLATDFAAIALGQLVRKGCFCMGSSDVVFMDPASGTLGSFSQTLLAEAAKAQIGRLLDLPIAHGHGGKARCRGFGPDTVAQASLTMLHAFHSRPCTCSYLGLVDGGVTYSLRTLLLCHDLVGLVRRQWQGLRVDDEMLALDLSKAVGPRGDYLAQPHTADHCRSERWPSRYLERRNAKDMEEAGESDVLERVDADLRDLLASHWPEPLPDAVRERMNSILEKYGAQLLA